MRILLCGFCLIAIQASSAGAQTLASATDNPVPARSAVTGGAARPSDAIPEVIRRPDARPLATSAPSALLTPPAVDFRFLRAGRNETGATD
jgi:hypothetical protein